MKFLRFRVYKALTGFGLRSRYMLSTGYGLRWAPSKVTAIKHLTEDRLCQAWRVPF
jgi:hypothetical protein